MASEGNVEPSSALAMNRNRPAREKKSWLRTAYGCLVYYGGLAGFGAMCLFWSVLVYPLAVLLPKQQGKIFGRRAIRFGFSLYAWVLDASNIITCDASALDALRDEPSLVIAANHPSLIDVVLIASRLPNVVCIMKAALGEQVMFGGGAKLAGYIRSASRTQMVADAVEEIKAGSQLLIFPEGTRTAGDELNPFKGGFALIAKRAKAPVQTVFIDVNHPFLGKARPLWRPPEFPIHMSVRLGECFPPPDDVQTSVFRIEDYCREQFRGYEP